MALSLGMAKSLGFLDNSYKASPEGHLDVDQKSYWTSLQNQAQSKMKRSGLSHSKNGNPSRKHASGSVCCSQMQTRSGVSLQATSSTSRTSTSRTATSRTERLLEPACFRA